MKWYYKAISVFLFVSASFLQLRADKITMTTELPVGSTIKLTISGEKNTIKLEGIEGDIVLDESSSYTLLNQTFSVEGEIVQLYCYDDKITSIDLSGCSTLVGLGCQGNKIKSLDLSDCAALEILFCDANPMEQLDVTSCPSMGRLSCAGCGLTDLKVKGCKNIFELSCDVNKLTEIDLSGLSNLMWLYCNDNQLEKLDIAESPLLQTILCNNNRLRSIDASKHTYLREIRCQGNRIKGQDLIEMTEHLLQCPEEEQATLYIVDTYDKDETNICTTEDVARLKAKGWIAYDYAGGANGGFGMPYAGSEPTRSETISHTAPIKACVVQGEMRVSGVSVGEALEVYDTTGHLIYQTEAQNTTCNIPLYSWPEGLYLIRIPGRECLKVMI